MPTIKTVQDFTAAVQTALTAAFPKCKIEAVDVTKNNDVQLTGLAIHPQNKKASPTIYMEPYFAAFQSGQPLAEMINQIIINCTSALSCTNVGIDTEEITDFNRVKDKICYKLINKNLNSTLLAAVPHSDYHDLAVVYYIHLALTDNGLSTLNVTHSLAKTWGVDEESLFALASSNTPRLCRGLVLAINDVLSVDLKTKPYTYFDFTLSDTDILPMYIATNTNKIYGAASILYDGLLDAAAEKLGSFYAIPSSVHELMFVPVTFGDAESIRQMVHEINGTEIPAEEILSDNIYCYDAESREFKIIA